MHSSVWPGAHSDGRLLAELHKSLNRKVASFPTITCGNNGWMSGLFEMKATWVGQALRFTCDAFSCACSEGGSLRLLETMSPFPPPWHEDTELSFRLMRSGCLPAALEQHSCCTIAALHGPAFWFLGPRKRDLFWFRNLSSKTVSLFGPHVRFLR